MGTGEDASKFPRVYYGYCGNCVRYCHRLCVNGINQANLKKALVKEWYDVDGSIIMLDIDEDEMESLKQVIDGWTLHSVLMTGNR